MALPLFLLLNFALPVESVLTAVLRECLDNLQKSWRISGHPVVVFATTAESDRVPTGILSCFKHEVTFEVRLAELSELHNTHLILQAPNEAERHEMLRLLVMGSVLAPDVSLSNLATETAALVAGDIANLVQRAESISIERASRISCEQILVDSSYRHSSTFVETAARWTS
jgi:peroxin-6